MIVFLGSGRINVRDFSGGPPRGDAGRYVQIVGRLSRWSPTASPLYVITTNVTPVTGDRVAYHLIEVAHTELRRRNG